MKIGLIAMSGIRVYDQELLNLGLTLPGFVERSKVIASLPSLGLLTLAGMTPDRHETEYVEVADLVKNNELNLVPDRFDLVAISSYSAQMYEAYRLAEYFRERGVKVVLGGLHASALPDEAKRHCDAVIIGEGEISWPCVIEDAEKGALKPFYGSVEDEFDFNNAPIPAFGLLDIKKYNRLTVQTSRGCPHRCEFCASSVLITKRYKQKPVDKVLAEVDGIRDLWEQPFIEFADDNSFVNRAYWKTLLPELKKRNIRWFTETDISVAQDSDLLRLMRESGCAQVLIGLESPSEKTLEGLETRMNWKKKQCYSYRQAIHEIQSHGISVNGCFVLGLDNHGPDIFDQVFEFVRESKLHEVQVTIQTAFPGTPLFKRLNADGRIMNETAWDKCTLFDLNFQPKNMKAEELTKGFRELVRKLYNREFTRLRRKNFRDMLREKCSAKTVLERGPDTKKDAVA